MTTISERDLIAQLTRGMPRRASQVNRLHESDAELVRVPGLEGVLAVTTDAIVEEIASGLYRDPYLIGWMAVVASASDLAAVGATPLGLVVSESLPPDLAPAALHALQSGLRDALTTHGVPLLGGDTSQSTTLQIGATALGIAPAKPITRMGAAPGDRLFVSGPLGLGSAFAFERLVTDRRSITFRPHARLAEGRVVAAVGSSCMDTSDGLVAALDELALLNHAGFQCSTPLTDAVHPDALAVAREAHLPPLAMLCGPHGEFELVFTVPERRCPDLLAAARAIGWAPIELGCVAAEPGLVWEQVGRSTRLDTTWIRGLFAQVGGDPRRYMEELVCGMVRL